MSADPSSRSVKSPSKLAAYADLFDRLRDCMLLVEPANELILEANIACEDILGYSPDAMQGLPVDTWVEGVGREEFKKALRISLRRYYPRHFESKWQVADGRILHMEIMSCPLVLSSGKTVLQLLLRDVSFRRDAEIKVQALLQQLQAANSRLEVLSTVDEMTGLYNFRHFKNELKKEHSRAVRFNQPYVIIFCDVDHFKNYNDRNGHPAGDQLLRELAETLKQTCRNTDFIARYGGEEFVVICPGIDSRGGAIAAERIRTAISSRRFFEGEHQPLGHISCSVGVASFPEHAAIPDLVLKAADEAVYVAKNEGRDRSSVFQGKL